MTHSQLPPSQPLGRFLVPLWALWGQLTISPGPTPTCTSPWSPQLVELDWFQFGNTCCPFRYSIDAGFTKPIRGIKSVVCAAERKDFFSSSLVTPPLWLSCGFSPTSVCGPPIGVCSRGYPEALGSAPVRTGHGGGTTAWVMGPPVVTGAQENWQPLLREIRP